MLDQSGLDLRCGESVPGDVDNIVHTSPDPVVAFMISSCAVASKLTYVSSRITKMKTRADLHSNPCTR